MNRNAKAWNDKGHIVFPLIGKKPLCRWADLTESCDHPKADGYGLRCDKLLVIDLDIYKPDFDAGFLSNIATFCPSKQTKSGGRHVYFHYVDGIKSKCNPLDTKGVDIKTGPRAYVRIAGPPTPLLTLYDDYVDKLKTTEEVEIVSNVDAKFDIKPYLDKIDADCDMTTWLCVLNAIKNLTGDMQLAWNWSQSSGGATFKVASKLEFLNRYHSLQAKRSKIQALRYLKRLANEV